MVVEIISGGDACHIDAHYGSGSPMDEQIRDTLNEWKESIGQKAVYNKANPGFWKNCQ